MFDRDTSEDDDGTLVRCEVTGKLIPATEAIDHDGRLVSPEGLGLLQLPPAEIPFPPEEDGIPDMLVRPSVLKRLAAAVIDILLLVAFDHFLMQTVFPIVLDGVPLSEMPRNPVVRLVGVEARFLYYACLHAVFGKTLGKLVCGTRVVTRDGMPISARTAMTRAFWSNGVFVLPVIVAFFSARWQGPAMQTLHMYQIANCLALILDEDENRALHDLLTGTRVIVVHPRLPESEPTEEDGACPDDAEREAPGREQSEGVEVID